MPKWTAKNLPSLCEKIAVITGTGGLALEVATQLAIAGATVIIAGRNHYKGKTAVKDIKERAPNSSVSFLQVDLASSRSIELFTSKLAARTMHIDLLINNAAVMNPPTRKVTEDGFELQFGTNYLSHFMLTAKLFPLLRASEAPRVITVSSIAANSGRINFDDLQAEKSYQPMHSYSMSKLACLMFALELQRKSDEQGWNLLSIAAHPGVSRTDLIYNGLGTQSVAGFIRKYFWFLFQPIEQGALPILYAACEPKVIGGEYFGPNKLMETRGYPAIAKIPVRAQDREAASQLWELSKSITNAVFE